MHGLLVFTLCAAALTGARAQEIGVSFEVFSSPKADCIATPPVVSASFASAFPPGTRLPKLFFSLAGSMPGSAGQEICQQMARKAAKTTVLLSPSFEGEVQGQLQVLSTAGNCTSQTTKAPLQFAVQLAGSQATEELGLISCPNPSVCHIYFASTTRPVRIAAGCVYCGDICRIVVKKGMLLNTVSDTDKGPCCDSCNCKFSHYVQQGKLWNRVRTYYYTCRDPSCFPASSMVEVAGKGRLPLSSLRMGDSVLAVNPKTGKLAFSEVYAMPHRVLSSRTAYLRVLNSNNHTLTVSAGHLLYTARQPSHCLSDYVALPASALRPGHYVWSLSTALPDSGAGGSGGPGISFGAARVERVDRVHSTGMVAPFTMEGTLVVDGVLASSYATHGAMSAHTAHAALAPLRWVWRVCPAVLQALHRREEGDSPALLAAGLHVLDAAERAQALLASA